MAIGATVSSRKAGALHRESKISSASESEYSPHFDGLSDGIQRLTNLEEMQGANDE
jgi:hypothetical protein